MGWNFCVILKNIFTGNFYECQCWISKTNLFIFHFSSGTFFFFHISLLKCYFDLLIWGSIFQSNYFWLTGLALALAMTVDFPQGRNENHNSEAAKVSSKLKSQPKLSWSATTLLYFLSLSFICPIATEMRDYGMLNLHSSDNWVGTQSTSTMMDGSGTESALYVSCKFLRFPSLSPDIGLFIVSIYLCVYINIYPYIHILNALWAVI